MAIRRFTLFVGCEAKMLQPLQNSKDAHDVAQTGTTSQSCLLVSAGKEHIYLLLKELLSNSDIHVVFSAESSNMSHITNDAKTTLGFVTLLKVVRFACHLTALVQDLPQHV